MASLKSQKATAPAFMPGDGRAVFLTDKAVLGAGNLGTPVATDTIDFFVPAGSRLCDLSFFLDDIDTNGVPAFAFGVGYRAANSADAGALPTNATYFAAAGQTIGQTGGRLECAFKPIKFEVDAYIQLLVGVAAATLNPANPEIHMIAGINAEGVK